ncbi:MAG: glycoside hydrolase family 9 protein [Chitinophagaceae bacterium]
MKNNAFILVALSLFTAFSSYAVPPGTITKHIKIDQFGYLPASRKVAVIADPQTGYNAAESFSPGTAANQYQVRRWSDDVVIFSGTIVAWNTGAVHAQSGDRGWWFDFSSVTTPGSYYIYDLTNNVGSYRFEIGSNVYAALLKQASRMYFYQRVNYAKQPPYVDPKWADGASFGGSNQDFAARSRYDKTNPATARDVHGGWFDAGDYNKYVTFALGPLCNLMESYRMHPVYFTDDYNLPESGNGIADILDEVKWELDFLTRMQDATGTNGLLLKVGADNFNSASPPSADNNPRYYVPECTSATLSGCAAFALGSTVYKSLGIPSMTTFGNDLLTRSINAWNRAKVTTSNFNVFETTCDDQNIVAGDADQGVEDQQDMIVTSAAYLFEATGSSEYKNAFDTMYIKARPYAFFWWGPYFPSVQRALLRYTVTPGSTTSVANNIRTVKQAQNGVLSITDYTATTDLYRASMPDAQYHWNSHEVKANAGINNLDFVSFSINPAQASLYKEVAESYLHWFHGVNPMGKVMLTNMYNYGGDSCVNEFYHSWFGDGTIWDNVFTSANGPAPGYLIGGPNKDFSIPGISPPGGQPPQKSYREWNTGWNGVANENSWEITEAGIYTQAAYISLLVRVIANSGGSVLPSHLLSINVNRVSEGARITWQVGEVGSSKQFEVQRSTDGNTFGTISTVQSLPGKKSYTVNDFSREAAHALVYYRIRETDLQGNLFYSSIIKLNTGPSKNIVSAFPNPAKEVVTLNGYSSSSDNIELLIYDGNARLVKRISWKQSTGSYSRTINLQELPAGVYTFDIKGTSIHQLLKVSKL